MTKTINYEKAFKKLVEQIYKETEWAKQDYETNCSWMLETNPKKAYSKGIMFAYRSIGELAKKLENDEFDED